MVPTSISYEEILFRLALATVLGGIIGYERESSHHSAGLRTHMLVSVSSALIGVGSLVLFHQYHTVTNMDPLRVGAQVISGIGFLGAGTILKHGSSIKGLTTAASLWGMAAVGLFTGLGAIIPCLMATAIIFIALTLSRYSDYLARKKGLLSIEIYARDKIGQVGEIGSILSGFQANIKSINMEHHGDEEVVYLLLVSMAQAKNMERLGQLITSLQQIPGVYKINVE
ncbi:MAG TPA: MgtC/SapB family protein [Clostridia bacterium]|nr:MgtC/SapB family protein [Clostridia bacterium]